ncbi:MAG: hypothetical protein KGZ84_00910 [Erysipelotrichia bacterium]|nr:hypothetical protein [Erysipelotrichia bacterium]
MKFHSFILMSLFFSVLLLSGCARSDELALGRYVMKDADIEDFAWVDLQANNRFTFNRHIATSYRPTGTYTIEDNQLTLRVNSEEFYVFKIVNKTLVFESEGSVPSLIEVGTVFELKKSNNQYN